MRIAVTGGSGFLGSHVVAGLAAEGHDVRILDVVPPRVEDALPYEGGSVEFVNEDLEDVNSLRQSLRTFDVVMHLAAVSNTRRAWENPAKCMEVNSLGTQTVFEAAGLAGVGRVVVAGSSLVSGALATDGADDPYTEEAWFDLSKVTHPYVMSKIHVEMIARVFSEMYGIENTVFRYGIQYGRNMAPGVVAQSFISKGLSGQPLIVNGDGEQWRQYTHVWDIAEAHVALVRDDKIDSKTTGLFNIVGTEKVTINEMAKIVSELAGVPVEHVDARVDDIEVQLLSNAKAADVLGWTPNVALEDGLTDAYSWYEKEVSSGPERDRGTGPSDGAESPTLQYVDSDGASNA